MIRKYIDKYQEEFKKCKDDFKSVKTWYRQIPNLLTVSRPIGMIPVNILFFTGNVIPAIILMGLLLSTDFIDGKLARKWNVQSKLGADLDAVGDKIMFLGLSLPLIVNNPLLIINLILEGTIAGINVFGRIKELNTETVRTGKIKTWFLSLTLGFGYLTQFFGIPASILRLFIGATALCQFIAIKDYIQEYKRMKKEKNDLDNVKDVEEQEIVMETLLDQEQQKKVLVPKAELNKIEELRKLRKLVLAIQEPNKVYTGKKKVREMIQSKRTIK